VIPAIALSWLPENLLEDFERNPILIEKERGEGADQEWTDAPSSLAAQVAIENAVFSFVARTLI
jgi:hypothetical protein